MNRVVFQPACLLVAAGIVASNAACTPSREVVDWRSARQAVYERTGKNFAQAAYTKLKTDDVDDSIAVLAPLIVTQLPHDSSESSVKGGIGEVYYDTRTTTLKGEPHEQVAFVWISPTTEVGHRFQGVRMTLDWEGYPIIWEVLHDPSGLRVLYVSRSLEDAAAERHGPPLPGRRFSIERSLDETPGVVVARVLDDGPVPMGPWVYLLDDAHTVATLLCRCMPSQADDFAATDTYTLCPMTELDLDEASKAAFPWLSDWADSARFDEALRLAPR